MYLAFLLATQYTCNPLPIGQPADLSFNYRALVMQNEFTVTSYQNNSQETIKATFQATVDGQCVQYITPVLQPGQAEGGDGLNLFHYKFDDSGQGSLVVYVEKIK
jgi:hypothetical protein